MGFRIGRARAQHTYPNMQNNVGTLLTNRVEQTNSSGTVIAAAGAITPDANLTVVRTGKVKISATASFTFTAGTGAHVTPLLRVSVNGGPFVDTWYWNQTAAGAADIAAVFTLNTVATVGQVIAVHWQTTAGDAAATLGNGVAASVLAASLLVEELP